LAPHLHLKGIGSATKQQSTGSKMAVGGEKDTINVYPPIEQKLDDRGQEFRDLLVETRSRCEETWLV